jgi:hypothetical protein
MGGMPTLSLSSHDSSFMPYSAAAAQQSGSGGFGGDRSLAPEPSEAEVRALFASPLADAAAKLGMCVSSFKKLCRRVRFSSPPPCFQRTERREKGKTEKERKAAIGNGRLFISSLPLPVVLSSVSVRCTILARLAGLPDHLLLPCTTEAPKITPYPSLSHRRRWQDQPLTAAEPAAAGGLRMSTLTPNDPTSDIRILCSRLHLLR